MKNKINPTKSSSVKNTTPLKVIFHIGMGKTGTSSIQASLSNNSKRLLEQNVDYLGMWFGMVDEKFDKFDGVPAFLSQSPEDLKKSAIKFYEYIHDKFIKNNSHTFIFSNEALFQNVHKLESFFTQLCQLVDVKLICYVRDPQSWLPSAYLQWGVRHKTQIGTTPPFNDLARSLIKQYDLIQQWDDLFGEILVVKKHDKNQDVALDFGKSIGVSLEENDQRYLERAEDSEYILRALFNNRYKEAIVPDHFNGVVMASKRFPPPTLDESINRYLNFNEINQIIAENIQPFDFIKERYGYDFLNIENNKSSAHNESDIRNRLIDYLIEITLDQSTRIKRLERIINESILNK
jgi:hypothetical protein